jgi:hypothetical protein
LADVRLKAPLSDVFVGKPVAAKRTYSADKKLACSIEGIRNVEACQYLFLLLRSRSSSKFKATGALLGGPAKRDFQ